MDYHKNYVQHAIYPLRANQGTEDVECRKNANAIDEIPIAYKNIDAVMVTQNELVEIVHQLRQLVCVKG